VITQVSDYDGGGYHEDEGCEPAAYLIAMDRASLSNAPPIEQINADIAEKQAELEALHAEASKAVRKIKSDMDAAGRELASAQRQLSEWMKTHRVMTDLGKLMDGCVLYPLSVRENPYHRGRDMPRIPEMRNAKYLAIHSGDFEKGQKWVCKQYGQDNYGHPFCFFDTKAERDAVIASEFDEACAMFRKAPNFDTTSHTIGTTLHYGTLMKWVEIHPALNIPEDINAMKAENDAKLVESRRAKLAAELALIDKSA
jgi:hypothetical protein